MNSENKLKPPFEVLKKPFNYRSKQEVEALAKFLGKSEAFSSLFKLDYDSKCLTLLSKHLECTELLPNNYLMQEGNSNHYFLLKGKLEVLAQETKALEILPGKSFSQVSLKQKLQENISVKSTSYAVLAVLTEHNYEVVYEKYLKSQNAKVSFFKQIDIFRRWSTVSLQKLCGLFKKKSLDKNQYLYREGDPLDCVYFIKTGQLKFTKTVELDTGNNFSPLSMVGVNQSKFRALFRESKAKNRTRKKESQVVVKSQNQVFGYEELLEDLTSRKLSCLCVSDYCELYCMQLSEFQKKVLNSEQSRAFDQNHSILTKWMKKRLKRLEKTEQIIQNKSFTKNLKIKTNSAKTSNQHSPVKSAVTPTLRFTPLPKILQPRSKSKYPLARRSRKEEYSPFFETELTTDVGEEKSSLGLSLLSPNNKNLLKDPKNSEILTKVTRV